ERRQERLPILVVLVESSESLELPRASEIVDHHARLAVAQHEAAEDVLAVARLGRALKRKEQGNLVLLEVSEGGHHRRGALWRDHREDPVLLHQLFGVRHRILRAVRVVVVDRSDLATVHTTRVVENPEVQIDPEAGQLGAREGQRSGEGVRSAEQDLRVRHASLGSHGCRPQHADEAAEPHPFRSDDLLLAIAARPPGMNSMPTIMTAPKMSGRKAWKPASEALRRVTMAAPATEPSTDPSPPRMIMTR